MLRNSYLAILVLGFSLFFGVNSIFAEQNETKSANMTEGIVFSENISLISLESSDTSKIETKIESFKAKIQELNDQIENKDSEIKSLNEIIGSGIVPEILPTVQSGIELVGTILDRMSDAKELPLKLIEVMPQIIDNIDFVLEPNNDSEERLGKIQEIKELIKNNTDESIIESSESLSNVLTILKLQESVLELTEQKKKLESASIQCVPQCSLNAADDCNTCEATVGTDGTVILTVVASIGAAAATAFGTFMIQKSKFKKEFQHDIQGIRTQKTAEEIARQLLEWKKYPKRKFTTIRHFLKGFDDDELRKILIRAGAVSFDSKKEEELWGLIERNKEDVFPKDEEVGD